MLIRSSFSLRDEYISSQSGPVFNPPPVEEKFITTGEEISSNPENQTFQNPALATNKKSIMQKIKDFIATKSQTAVIVFAALGVLLGVVIAKKFGKNKNWK